MSVKLYDGMILVPSGIHNILKGVNALREKIRPVRSRMINDILVRTSVEISDDFYLSGIDRYKKDLDFEGRSPFWAAHEYINHRVSEIARTRMRDPEVDFEFKLSIYPVPGTKRVLLYPEFEQPEFLDILRNETDFVQPYGYWNNTDPDPEVPSAVWNRRRRDWNMVWEDPNTSTNGGFVITVSTGDLHMAELRSIVAEAGYTNDIISDERRIKRLVHRDASRDFHNIVPEEKRNLFYDRPYSMHLEFEKWINGEARLDYNIKYEKYAALIRRVHMKELLNIEMHR